MGELVISSGAIIMIDAEPHAGREEGGHNPKAGNIRRPAVVVSRTAYNQQTGFVICMPITSKKKTNQKLYLPIADIESGINGSIITFQTPMYDFHARHGKVIGQVKPTMLHELSKRAKMIFA